MSEYSAEYLANNILVGFTEKRGEAWWKVNDGISNHYPTAVPIEDVRAKLINWEAVKQTPMVETTISGGENDGAIEMRPLKDYRGKSPVALVRSDTGMYLGTVTDEYPDHGYDDRLLKATEAILDDELQIGSAGLLKGGSVMWVQVEVPDNIVSASTGDAYRPFIVAMSSFDGSLATTYKCGATRVVCDNTFSAFNSEKSAQHKIRNTSQSGLKIANAREALDIMFKANTEFEAEIAKMSATKVTDGRWAKFLERYVPIPTDDGRGKTVATKRRDALVDLYHTDERVAPFKGTKYGVLQAVNTYSQHVQNVRTSMVRQERNQFNALRGELEKTDGAAMKMLDLVLAGK